MIDDMMKLSVDAFFSDFTPPSGTPPEHVPTFNVPGYSDEENMWEQLCNLRDKRSRREAKVKHILTKPHILNSPFAFQVKDRSFKIKKYIAPTAMPLLPSD